jgi:LTXXQ motif family protein
VATRLQALDKAVHEVKPALKKFYASLNDDQKARFNLIGSMSAAAATQTDTKTGTGP